MISLKIIKRREIHNLENTVLAISECNQLIAIFVKSIETAKKNNLKQQ